MIRKGRNCKMRLERGHVYRITGYPENSFLRKGDEIILTPENKIMLLGHKVAMEAEETLIQNIPAEDISEEYCIIMNQKCIFAYA